MTPDEIKAIIEEMERIAKIQTISASPTDTQWQFPKTFSGGPIQSGGFATKGRQMSRMQATKDRFRDIIQSYQDQYPVTSESAIPPMPSFYPTLKPFGSGWELTLPDATPATFVFALNYACCLTKLDDYRCHFPNSEYQYVKDQLIKQFGKVNEESEPKVDPQIELFVEYVGQCRSHPNEAQARSVNCNDCNGSGLSTTNRFNPNYLSNNCSTCLGQGRIVSTEGAAYASGWVDGGWNVRFSEKVLKDYFGEPVATFDGDFMRALYSSKDMRSTFRKFAYQYHTDRPGGGNKRMFQKLTEAYKILQDPQLKRRYEAGLKFQTATKQIEKEVVFKVPMSCGMVTVRGEWVEVSNYKSGGTAYWMANEKDSRDYHRRLNVTQILKWDEIIDKDGRVMTATWSGDSNFNKYTQRERGQEKPFTTSWEDRYVVEFDVAI